MQPKGLPDKTFAFYLCGMQFLGGLQDKAGKQLVARVQSAPHNGGNTVLYSTAQTSPHALAAFLMDAAEIKSGAYLHIS
ncbi:hypothetical protein D3C73_1466650 [compost metagenome]